MDFIVIVWNISQKIIWNIWNGSMNNLIQKFNSLKDLFNRKLGNYEATKQRLNMVEEQVINLTTKEDNLKKASIFLQSLSDTSRVQTIDKISQIVTDALQTVKDKNLEFKMQLNVERNQPSLEMKILNKLNGQEYSILDSFGGGISDIISMTLRIALLVLWKPKLSKVLILDEVGKFISVKDQELLAEFIKQISNKLGIQFVWITHSEVLTKVASKVFEVTQENGVSNVTEKATSI
jgi:ABC-type iron transport system FetAB ATPase subunit